MASEGFTAKWINKSTNLFVTLMVEEVKKGNRTTSTFGKKAWKSIKDEFTKQTGLDYTLHQLKNKMNKLRQEYSSFKKLLSIPGFGWNTFWKIATTEDASLWDVHIKDNPQWEKFRKNGLPYWEQLVEIFGDVYASKDNGVGNAEVHQISDGDGDNIDSLVETTIPLLHRQEYKEDEHMLNEDLFASDPVETPSPVLHRQDWIPNAKGRRRSGNKDIAMACQAIQDLAKIRQNQCHHNFANFAAAKLNEDPYSIEAAMDVLNNMVGLENEAYHKAVDRMVESQAWRVAFIKALPKMRALLI